MKVENFMDFLSLGGLGMFMIGVIGKALCCDSDKKEEVKKENEVDRKMDEESSECGERGSDEDRPSKDGWFAFKTDVSETDPRICSGCVHKRKGCTGLNDHETESVSFYTGIGNRKEDKTLVLKRIRCQDYEPSNPE